MMITGVTTAPSTECDFVSNYSTLQISLLGQSFDELSMQIWKKNNLIE